MAVLNPMNGLLEQANRTANGQVISIAKCLSRVNQLFSAIPWLEANTVTGHSVSRRTYLPTGSKRRYNDGVAVDASKTVKVNECMQMLDSISFVDVAFANTMPDPVAYRRTEDEAHVEGMGQTIATDMTYGNVNVDADSMHGFAPRRPTLATPGVYTAGGSGNDVTSVWVGLAGENGVYGIYPRGSQVGVEFQDMGIELVPGKTANTWYRAYRSYFAIAGGIALADERALKRIPNIEASGSNSLDEDLIIRAISELPGNSGQPFVLMNKQAAFQLNVIGKDKANVNYTMTDIFGRPIPDIQGVPIFIQESILSTETALA